jgi:hypothetical protein
MILIDFEIKWKMNNPKENNKSNMHHDQLKLNSKPTILNIKTTQINIYLNINAFWNYTNVKFKLKIQIDFQCVHISCHILYIVYKIWNWT